VRANGETEAWRRYLVATEDRGHWSRDQGGDRRSWLESSRDTEGIRCGSGCGSIGGEGEREANAAGAGESSARCHSPRTAKAWSRSGRSGSLRDGGAGEIT